MADKIKPETEAQAEACPIAAAKIFPASTGGFVCNAGTS